ncbi:toll/interleukin-1 receptor domain-containing protein [Streptomyces bugieae]|uniref:Toll/interleukin-1 receptor domain-containing protein n=1 Tax=Streptomyces bugieae TaxID=3098223 RepID=A0ABU7NYX8_9ACTN|nr:toll/interleukin-1 receptor domain-containing protein [Streptomyces sp. DSM 41528]
MIKVFLSHSSKADPHAREVRELVAHGLRRRGYDVLVDVEGLSEGEEWRARVYHWLAECEAAVVLVNRHALESEWVRKEAALLMWRRFFNPALHVVPALVGGVTARELSASGLRELGALQAARPPCRGVAPAEEAAAVLAGFPEVPVRGNGDVVGEWVENIAAQLRQVWTPERLTKFGEALDLPPDDVARATAPVAGHGFLAAQMLHTHEVARLGRVIETIRYHIDEVPLGHLVTLTLPVWVDAGSARHVLPAGQGAHRRTVVLNVRNPDTGTYYLSRAYCVDSSKYLYTVAGLGSLGEEDEETALRAECERAVKHLLGMHQQDRWEDAVEERERSSYLILDARRLTLEQAGRVVSWMHDRVAWLHILLIPPQPVAPRDQWPAGLREALLLEPPFGADDEQLAVREARRMTERRDAARSASAGWRRP